MIEGQLVTPTLRLVRALGHGGMGSVWVADHLSLHTQVAVKFMYAKFATKADYVRRFQTEAIAAAAIKSPHVAQVFDHGITDEYEPYIVMELLEGEDLRARLKRSGPLTPAELAPIVSQVCKALTRAHAIGIVHRDIKPDNVFLVNMGDETFVKILDFGIAKLADDMNEGFTMTGNTLGTPYYMSPEQLLSSKAVDFRSDLWSVGVVVYQALTGARPFRGETIGAVSVAVHAGSFASPSAARTGLSPAIDAWVATALQGDPARRFGSAKEMGEAFERAVQNPNVAEVYVDATADVIDDGKPSTPRPTPDGNQASTGPTLAGTAHTGVPQRKRRAPLLIGAGVAVIALGVAAGFQLVRLSPSNRSRPVVASPSTVAPPPLPLPVPLPAASPSVAALPTAATPRDPSESSSAAAGSASGAPVSSVRGIDPNDLPAAPGGAPVAAQAPVGGPRRAVPPKTTAAPPATPKDTIGF